jgi:membrane-associated protein
VDNILVLLEQYKYFILFPLAVVEGPILAVIAGFLCSTGIMSPVIVLPVIVLGDVTGDSICYLIGRSGRPAFLKKYGYWFGLDAGKINRVSIIFNTNPVKTISLSKIVLGIGVAGIYLAGYTRIPYRKFISICVITSVLQYIFYLTIGLLFGSAYKKINQSINFIASVFIIVSAVIVVFFIIRSIQKKI